MSKKKREFTFWGCRRQPIKLGELSGKMKQINPLPEVGTYVVIHECVTYTETNVTKQMVTGYMPSSNYFDVWGHPVAYQVKSYSKGIGDPLNKDNVILLERKCKNGYVLRATLRSLDVAIGVFLLKEIERVEDAKGFRSRFYSYQNCIVRETSGDLMQKALLRRGVCREAV